MERYNLILEDDSLINVVASSLKELKNSTKLTGHCLCIDKKGNAFFIKKNKNSYTITAQKANRRDK